MACFKIWTSDLKRSWQTANLLIKSENNDDLDNNFILVKPLPTIQTDVRIRERVRFLYCSAELCSFIILNLKHYGIAQGHSTANLQKLASKAGTKVNNYVPPEAESPEDVRNRAISFFKVKIQRCNQV